MAEEVEIQISVVGADDGSKEFLALAAAEEQVTRATEDMTRAAGRAEAATKKQTQAAEKAKKESENLKRALSTQILGWGALGTAVGQAGAVLSRVSPQFAGFGAVLGQAGQSITTVATALAAPSPASITSALISVGATIVDAISAWQNYQDATRETERDLNAIAAAAKTAAVEIAGLTAALRAQARGERIALFGATQEDLEAEIAAVGDLRRRSQAQESAALSDINLQRARFAELETERTRVGTVTRGAAILREQRDIEATIGRIEESRAISEARTTRLLAREGQLRTRQLQQDIEDRSVVAEEAAEADADRARSARRTGGQSEAEREEEARRAGILETRRIEVEGMRALRRLDLEFRNEKRVEALETDRLAQAIHDNKIRRLEEIKALELAAAAARLTALQDAKDKEEQAAAELQSTLEGTLGPIVQSTTDALANIISGAQSAEEAFQGLLASFLEMLAQQAALEAVKEFAAAIGSFASQDYVGGALHLASGGAWVAVAALAGGAAAAVAPATPAVPASPEQARDTGGGGGGTTVNNFNAPIVSTQGASGRARAGRELEDLGEDSRRRFSGRAS